METQYVSWWILRSSPGALQEEGKTGKRKQNVWHYKHLARQGAGEIGRRNDICPPLSFPFSTLCSPSPAGCFTMCTS